MFVVLYFYVVYFSLSYSGADITGRKTVQSQQTVKRLKAIFSGVVLYEEKNIEYDESYVSSKDDKGEWGAVIIMQI